MGARFSAPIQTDLRVQSASSTMGNRSFPSVKRPGRNFHHPTDLASRSKKEESYIPLLPLWSFMACSRVNIFTLLLTALKKTPPPLFLTSDIFHSSPILSVREINGNLYFGHFFFSCIRPTTAISMNYAHSESFGIRLGEYKKNIRSTSSVLPEVNLTSIARSGRAE